MCRSFFQTLNISLSHVVKIYCVPKSLDFIKAFDYGCDWLHVHEPLAFIKSLAHICDLLRTQVTWFYEVSWLWLWFTACPYAPSVYYPTHPNVTHPCELRGILQALGDVLPPSTNCMLIRVPRHLILLYAKNCLLAANHKTCLDYT